MAKQRQGSDIAVVDRETGEARLLVEVKARAGDAHAADQLIDMMRMTRTRAGLLVDPVETKVITFLSFSTPAPRIETIPSASLGIKVGARPREKEMEREVLLALRSLSDAARAGDYRDVPKVLLPDVMTALDYGELLLEH